MVKLLLEKIFTSNNLQVMPLVKRFFVFSRAMFNSALRNVFSSSVSVSKDVEFTILSAEFESFKTLNKCVNVFNASFRKYFERVTENSFFALASC